MTLDVREITARGSGAVSIVSVRGGGALERVRSVFAEGEIALRVPRLVRLKHAGADLDEALVCAVSADEVEIHLHGSPVLVSAVLAALDAASGEPPRSIADRARALLPTAASEAGARILLDQAEGAWRRFQADLVRATEPGQLVREVLAHSKSASFAIRAPVVVLAGAVNAGKSTLFNVLVGSERAITSPEPGTTRDLVRSACRLGRYVIELVDTAGERELDIGSAQSAIEAAGIERALDARTRADVVLWLAADRRADRVPARAVVLYTQSDRFADAFEPHVSALSDPAAARDVVARLVHGALGLVDDPWTPGAARAFDPGSWAVLERWSACRSDAELRDCARRFEDAGGDASA